MILILNLELFLRTTKDLLSTGELEPKQAMILIVVDDFFHISDKVLIIYNKVLIF
jgi:hypothetical protein